MSSFRKIQICHILRNGTIRASPLADFYLRSLLQPGIYLRRAFTNTDTFSMLSKPSVNSFCKIMARNFGHLSPRIKQWATRQIYANEARCRLQENPLRLIINNYIRFPLSFYATQQLARNIEADFMMGKELLLGENVVR